MIMMIAFPRKWFMCLGNCDVSDVTTTPRSRNWVTWGHPEQHTCQNRGFSQAAVIRKGCTAHSFLLIFSATDDRNHFKFSQCITGTHTSLTVYSLAYFWKGDFCPLRLILLSLIPACAIYFILVTAFLIAVNKQDKNKYLPPFQTMPASAGWSAAL